MFDIKTKEILGYINGTPALLSALYDANLLPEQTMSDPLQWVRTVLIAELFKRNEEAMGAIHRFDDIGIKATKERDALRAELTELGKAFDGQTKELETAVALLEELGAEHALEYRRRAYPDLYPRP